MKIVRNSTMYLQLLNALSFAVIMYTIIYGSINIKALPENLHIPRISSGDILVNKSVLWDDISLMVICYLVISLICVYLKVIPFRNNKGQAMALMASFMNLCISSVFAFVIIGTLKQALN